jgi:deazaflavin-dependent oxidoreductase (nitroreductase family)
MRGESRVKYERPSVVEGFFNRVFGLLVRAGVGMRHNVLLQVRGRKSCRVYSTPVNVLEHDGRRYLVAPRGHTQWSRNALASGEVTLVRGFRSETVAVRPVADEAKPEILKAYLDAFATTVQRYFSVRAGSPADAFRAIAPDYPVFDITR